VTTLSPVIDFQRTFYSHSSLHYDFVFCCWIFVGISGLHFVNDELFLAFCLCRLHSSATVVDSSRECPRVWCVGVVLFHCSINVFIYTHSSPSLLRLCVRIKSEPQNKLLEFNENLLISSEI